MHWQLLGNLADVAFMAAAAVETSSRALDYASDEIRPKMWAELMVNDDGAAKLKAEWLAKVREKEYGLDLSCGEIATRTG